MANNVWHAKLGIELDLARDDLGHPGMPGLWDRLYAQDRVLGSKRIPVAQRGLQCAGICQTVGVVAWMYLRERGGRRQAVHERAEDEARHLDAPISDEHKAYQERVVRTAEDAGFRASSEVRTPTGPKTWIQTDTLVEGDGGLRIGWEIQLSTAGVKGPQSVRSRAGKAQANGITPAWHTDRVGYGQRNDTQWTRSDSLPSYVIAKTGDLRVISGFRVLEFWRCDATALYQCPDGKQGGCGKRHVTPKPRDVLFDELVRKTAAGSIVPLEHHMGSRTQRFWVPAEDRDRYLDAGVGPPPGEGTDPPVMRGSDDAPTCRPRITLTTPAPRVLDWRDSSHWTGRGQPCHYCHKPTPLIDDAGTPMHKACHEAAAWQKDRKASKTSPAQRPPLPPVPAGGLQCHRCKRPLAPELAAAGRHLLC